MAKLTNFQVKHAKPGRHADGNGLYLLVKPSGSKSWILRVQTEGRRRDFGLGSSHLLSLTEARDRAREGLKLAKAGLDPSFEWKKGRRTVPTFEDAARQYHESVKDGWANGKHRDQWISTLVAHAFPQIGNTRVDHIDAALIQSVLLPIWLVTPETGRRVRQRVFAVLNFAHGQGWRASEAPRQAVNSLMKGIKQPKKGNFAAMPYSDVPTFMSKLGELEATTGRLALRFLILTAARSGEVRGASWDEIDWGRTEWTVPAERMKMREAHTVPLSPAAISILRQMKSDKSSDIGLIFPGLRRKPLSDMTLAKVLKTTGGEAYTVHGFRSTFRDWVAEQTSFPGEWAEAALAHTQANKVEAAYRRTKFLDQRRSLMEQWSAYAVEK